MHQSHIRRLVELVLYGTGDQRRFVQDSAIFPEVWMTLLETQGGPVPVLLQPFGDTRPSEVARELTDRELTRQANGLKYNSNLVSLTVTTEQVVVDIVPLTRWFQDAKILATQLADRAAAELVANPWADVPIAGERRVGGQLAMLSFYRIAGVALYSARSDTGPRSLLAEIVSKPPEEAQRDIAGMALRGWWTTRDRLVAMANRPSPQANVFSITSDRRATLSVADSRRTVKADAAHAVFDLSCRKLRWAVMDSGIDASHPAFFDRISPKKGKPTRVVSTYDFSLLHEILAGEDEALPKRLRTKSAQRALTRVRRRADEFLPIDWGLLLPILEVAGRHRAGVIDRHGTHVAGTLGGYWEGGPRGLMAGMCHDIQLIDVRVCKPDGTSSEFVLTAALQFLRYLNANADQMAVHGVNISLSLDHDVANYACGRTPICMEAEKTVGSGIVVVAAAGNRGYRHIRAADDTSFYQFCAVSITDPGNAESVITVGSTHRREPHNFGVSYFSSRGPTGDGRLKPDLVAPGEKIFAPIPDSDAVTMDGTSMAAPHVSGAAALLMARHPELIGQPARIKSILCKTATDLGRERYFQGHGLVDVLRALQSV